MKSFSLKAWRRNAVVLASCLLMASTSVATEWFDLAPVVQPDTNIGAYPGLVPAKADNTLLYQYFNNSCYVFQNYSPITLQISASLTNNPNNQLSIGDDAEALYNCGLQNCQFKNIGAGEMCAFNVDFFSDPFYKKIDILPIDTQLSIDFGGQSDYLLSLNYNQRNWEPYDMSGAFGPGVLAQTALVFFHKNGMNRLAYGEGFKKAETIQATQSASNVAACNSGDAPCVVHSLSGGLFWHDITRNLRIDGTTPANVTKLLHDNLGVPLALAQDPNTGKNEMWQYNPLAPSANNMLGAWVKLGEASQRPGVTELFDYTVSDKNEIYLGTNCGVWVLNLLSLNRQWAPVGDNSVCPTVPSMLMAFDLDTGDAYQVQTQMGTDGKNSFPSQVYRKPANSSTFELFGSQLLSSIESIRAAQGIVFASGNGIVSNGCLTSPTASLAKFDTQKLKATDWVCMGDDSVDVGDFFHGAKDQQLVAIGSMTTSHATDKASYYGTVSQLTVPESGNTYFDVVFHDLNPFGVSEYFGLSQDGNGVAYVATDQMVFRARSR